VWSARPSQQAYLFESERVESAGGVTRLADAVPLRQVETWSDRTSTKSSSWSGGDAGEASGA
jgi:hypothetical protein